MSALRQSVQLRSGAKHRYAIEVWPEPRSRHIRSWRMTTKLDRALKREITVDGKPFVVTIDPQGLKVTAKGKRKGQELAWKDLLNGEAALATALNASLAQVND